MLISVDSSDSCGGYDKALRTGCLLGGVRNAPTGNSRRSAPADQPARGRGPCVLPHAAAPRPLRAARARSPHAPRAAPQPASDGPGSSDSSGAAPSGDGRSWWACSAAAAICARAPRTAARVVASEAASGSSRRSLREPRGAGDDSSRPLRPRLCPEREADASASRSGHKRGRKGRDESSPAPRGSRKDRREDPDAASDATTRAAVRGALAQIAAAAEHAHQDRPSPDGAAPDESDEPGPSEAG